MDIVFINLLILSLSAGIVILIIIPLRLILRRGSSRLIMILWLIVGVRLLLPFTFDSPISLIPEKISAPVNISRIITGTALISDYPAEEERYSTGKIVVPTVEAEKESGVFPVSGQTECIILKFIAPIVWFTGVTVMLLYMILTNLRLQKNNKNAVYLTNNIYIIQGVDTAYISGVIHPKIYLPASLTAEESAYVLQHELGHVHRKDSLVKWFSFLLLCVYWFNPLIWLGFFMMCHDMEYACDEFAVRMYTHEEKCRYSEILLRLSSHNRIGFSAPLGFGEVNVKRRIRYILQDKHKSRLFNISIILAAVCLIVCTMSTEEISSPIKPWSEEWNRLNSIVDKKKACSLPVRQMKMMTTEALVETIMNYPFITDVNYYMTGMGLSSSYEGKIKESFYLLGDYFQGVEILKTRSDAIEEIEKYLQDKGLKEGDNLFSVGKKITEYLMMR